MFTVVGGSFSSVRSLLVNPRKGEASSAGVPPGSS